MLASQEVALPSASTRTAGRPTATSRRARPRWLRSPRPGGESGVVP